MYRLKDNSDSFFENVVFKKIVFQNQSYGHLRLLTHIKVSVKCLFKG